jgi:hypothetical protein
MEALQTDIMRFMAILGLCLSAIFSLVQGAAREQAGAEQISAAHTTIEEAVVGQVTLETISVKQATPEQHAPEHSVVEKVHHTVPVAYESAPAITQGATAVGFTLEFASVQALEMLLQAGQVQLYARHRDHFWSVDTQGVALPVETPSSYYQMHTETVPQRLRSAFSDRKMTANITWGVTLPSAASGQIQRLTSGHKSGNLLIGDDGVVALEGASGNIAYGNSRSYTDGAKSVQ